VKYSSETSLNNEYTLKKKKSRKVKQILFGGVVLERGKVDGEGEGR
jgi:hypothetical protein